MTPIAVVTTVATREDADRLAEALVGGRLAACAQIEPIESCYFWNGALQRTAELRVLFKTTAERYDAVEQAILAQHPYELPAVHAVAIDRIHAPYAAWIVDNSTPAG